MEILIRVRQVHNSVFGLQIPRKTVKFEAKKILRLACSGIGSDVIVKKGGLFICEERL